MFKLTVMILALMFIPLTMSFTPTKPKPIALVKYGDTIYHCDGIIKTKCGHTISCGKMTVHCVTNLDVQYL